MALSAGLAVGYVAGTAAGRPAFERISARTGSLMAALGLTDAAERIQEGGEGVAKATVDLAATATRDVVDNATTRVEQQLSDAQARLETVSAPNGQSHA
jgi:hypothetical protein